MEVSVVDVEEMETAVKSKSGKKGREDPKKGCVYKDGSNGTSMYYVILRELTQNESVAGGLKGTIHLDGTRLP